MNQLHSGPADARQARLPVLAVLLLLTVLGLAPAAGQAADPTNMTECVGTLTPMIEARCQSMFSGSEERSNCLAQVTPHVQNTCQQFFGEGQDFCATCTSSCTRAYPSGDPKRRECLSMCLSQPRCQ